MSQDPDRRLTERRDSRPDDYEPPRVETVLSAEDLEREVVTGGAQISGS